jgi:hypothetical protein
MPEWLAEAYPVYFGTDDDGMAQYIKLEGFLPAVDLNLFGRLLNKRQPLEPLLEMATPLIKTPVELAANYSLFFENQITEFEGQKKPFLGINISPNVEYALRNIRPLQELNKLLGAGNQKKIADAKTRFMNYMIGKSYNLNLTEQRQVFEYVQSLQGQQVKKDLNDAREKGDREEVTRLTKLLKEVEQGKGIHL